jgi:hypothetical protein
MVGLTTSLAILCAMVGSGDRNRVSYFLSVEAVRVYARSGFGSLAGIWLAWLWLRHARKQSTTGPLFQFGLQETGLVLAVAGPAGWLLWNWPEALAMVGMQQLVFVTVACPPWDRSIEKGI